MSFLSKALTVVGAVVGIAAAVATGGALGFLAAGLIGLGAASSLGLVGGSIGKFMNSGIGRGLVFAAGAYAAIGAYTSGMSAAQANQAEATADLNAAAGKSIAAVNAQVQNEVAASLPNLAGGASAAGTNGMVSSLADATTAGASGAPLAEMQSNAAAMQVSEQQTSGALNQVASASGHDMPGMGGEGPTPPPMAGSPSAAQSAVTATPPGGQADPLAAANDANRFTHINDVKEGADTAGSGGWLDKAGKLMDNKGVAAAITAGGSMLGGIGQGMAQKQAIEDEIRASQWSNNRWMTPGLANQAVQASQGSINVPGGYLQRAQQTRALVANSGVPWSGGVTPPAPTPVPGVPGPVRG